MDIQTEVQKIHHQFGVSEKANYEIQKLFEKAIKEAATEALRIHDVSGMCEHPWASVMGDGEMKPAKCLKCGKYL